jgi:hypothetical protein
MECCAAVPAGAKKSDARMLAIQIGQTWENALHFDLASTALVGRLRRSFAHLMQLLGLVGHANQYFGLL